MGEASPGRQWKVNRRGTRETQLTFAEIPLERVERGLRWLATQPYVAAKAGRVALVGASRGGELALLAAAAFPSLVGPVVAYTPSSVAWVGIDMSLPPGVTRSSWTRDGEAVPYLTFPPGTMPTQTSRGLSISAMCAAALDDVDAASRASVRVEQAAGPLLLVSGGDDGVWPARRMCELAIQRMTEHGRARDLKHLHFANAGHMLFPYQRPSDTLIPEGLVDLGGSAEADAAAHASAWQKVVETLRG